MTEDISRIYNSLLGKDKRKEKYYFAIDGLSTTKEGNELRISLYPLKKKGSADIFKDVVDEATRSNYEKIEYREYPSYASEFPTNVLKLSLKEVAVSQVQNQPQFSGFGGAQEVFNSLGGFAGFFANQQQNTELSINNKWLTRDIEQKEKQLNKANSDLEILRKEHDELKEKYKQVVDEKSKLADKLTIGSLLSKGIIGTVASKIGLDENTLKGLYGANVEQQAETQNYQSSNDDDDIDVFSSEKPQMSPYVQDIVNFLNNQTTDIQRLISGIMEWFNNDLDNITRTYKYIKHLEAKKQEQNYNQATQQAAELNENEQENGNIESNVEIEYN